MCGERMVVCGVMVVVCACGVKMVVCGGGGEHALSVP